MLLCNCVWAKGWTCKFEWYPDVDNREHKTKIIWNNQISNFLAQSKGIISLSAEISVLSVVRSNCIRQRPYLMWLTIFALNLDDSHKVISMISYFILWLRLHSIMFCLSEIYILIEVNRIFRLSLSFLYFVFL